MDTSPAMPDNVLTLQGTLPFFAETLLAVSDNILDSRGASLTFMDAMLVVDSVINSDDKQNG